MFFITLLLWRKRELPPGSDAIADFKFQKNVKRHHMSEQSLFRRSAPYKSSHSDQRFNKKHRAFCSVFFITLLLWRKRELPPGSDAIADFKFQKNVKRHHMSEQSLFRRSAPYKSSHSDQRFNKKHRAFCSVFFITLLLWRKRELPPGSDAIADFKFQKT